MKKQWKYYKNRSDYVFIPLFDHGKAIKYEPKSCEVRENWVRESDGRDSIELRMIQINWR